MDNFLAKGSFCVIRFFFFWTYWLLTHILFRICVCWNQLRYPPNHGYAPTRTSCDGYAPMDMLLPTVDMPLPGPPMVDMLLPTVDMLSPAMNTLLSEPTTADTSFVSEGYAGWTYLSQHNQQYNRTGLFSFKRENLIYNFISQANILFFFTLIKSKELWAAHSND